MKHHKLNIARIIIF